MARDGLRHFLRVLSFSSALACVMLTPLSSLAATYIETGFGVGELKSIDKLYGGSDGSTGLGLGLNFTLATTFGNASSLVQFQFGVQQRVTSASANGSTYNLITTYPLIRFETSRFYVGLGATPFVAANKSSLSFSSYPRVPGAIAGVAEFGLLWRVVPFFNIALEASLEDVSCNGANSPLNAQGTLQMRFFFGEGNKVAGQRKYDGWRYPFGIEAF